MMGRPPKPAALKAIDGDKNNIGATKHAEALKALGDVPVGLPEAPATLSEDGRRNWDWFTSCAGAEKLFREADASVLAAACEIYAAFQKAVDAQDWNQMDKLLGRYLNVTDRLGMSPAARARLQLGADEGDKLKRPDASAWKERKAG